MCAKGRWRYIGKDYVINKINKTFVLFLFYVDKQNKKIWENAKDEKIFKKSKNF
jgi:hypothetical protein